MDEGFAYAYTLSGHEYVASDDLEKALICFRNAIRMDDRHYNAWYGLGLVYYRQEKFSMAEYHFRRALQINGVSSVLYCYMGMVLHAKGDLEQALEMLHLAITIGATSNALAKFKKASVLFSMGRLDEALEEVQRLLESGPKEASSYFLIGQIYKELGKVELAMVAFSTALDLSETKNQNHIKSQIEDLFAPDINH
eukprot:TRINITY_DN7937_c0_g1_i2.p1 TRINITY_DN7937_c0_g1~~TRINITY_DN7937_c0_g1_i2.p1  ORF type:complete len:196 (+),score=36.66 TRINITY_DN7937_c0_g1_i2:108-695(+)